MEIGGGDTTNDELQGPSQRPDFLPPPAHVARPEAHPCPRQQTLLHIDSNQLPWATVPHQQ
eukprot:7156755-Prorocentrum_lima.AAC.1